MDFTLDTHIQKIFSVLNKNNLKAYLVGGVVRDFLIEKHHKIPVKNKDYDIEVFGVSLSELENLLLKNLDCRVQKEGESFAVLKVYFDDIDNPIDVSIPRTEQTTGNSYTDFNITPNPNLTVKEASLRRDITINAIYFDPTNKELVDPFNGVSDIENKVIRAVSNKTFIEDPLRVLRVMQFSARFGFNVHPSTITLCKEMVDKGMLSALSKDRAREEFLKFAYKSRYPSFGIEFLRECNLLKIYMPEILDLLKVKQTKHWHPEGNVYNHTLQVLNAGASIAEREGLSSYEQATLLFSCLYHDSGKALTTVYDEKDKVYRAHGHADAGIGLVNSFAKRVNLPTYLLRGLPILVKYHMHLPTLYYNHKKGEDQTKAFRRLHQKLVEAGVNSYVLLWLVEADRRGRKENEPGVYEPYPQSYLDEFLRLKNWFDEMSNLVLDIEKPEKEVVSGAWILEVLGKKQGVWVGAVKEFIKDLLLTKDFVEDKKRFELYKSEGKVQEELVLAVYEFLDSKSLDWRKVIDNEDFRDELIEEFVNLLI